MTRLDALLRVARHAAWHPLRDHLVLRGGLVMQRQTHPVPRPVDDVDFLVLANSLDQCRAIFQAVFPTCSFEITWAEMERPGLRASLIVGFHEVQIDAGFGDPLVVPPQRFSLGELTIGCVAPELHFAWKLHGLFERGRGRWRPKDLMDLVALKRHGNLRTHLVGSCIRTAFASRNESLTQIDRLVMADFGNSRGSRRRWRRFVEARTDRFGEKSGVPPSHLPLIAELAGFVAPLLSGASNRQSSQP